MNIVSGNIIDGIGNISILGYIDMFSNAKMKSELWALVYNRNVTHLSIDLRDVGYIDSSGIGTLMSFIKMLRQSGAKVKVINLQDKVYSVIRLANLNKFFEME